MRIKDKVVSIALLVTMAALLLVAPIGPTPLGWALLKVVVVMGAVSVLLAAINIWQNDD